MKLWTKRLLGFALAVTCAFVLFSFSCTKDSSTANVVSAGTIFADTSPAVTIPAEPLSVVESLQTVYRAVCEQVLPSVVEVDVVEVIEQDVSNTNPFYYFFNFGDEDSSSQKREYKQSGLGSGVIVRKNGNTYYVLTNDHVAGDATEITIKLNDGREFEGKLIGTDDRKDIALVSFESDDNTLTVAKLGDSDTVHVGDICFAMGAPLGYSSSVTQGIVSALGRTGSDIGNISDFIQTDAAINQGNSGGPLVNIYGEIIGINTWIASQSGGSQGIGFSNPINNVSRAIDDFINNGKISYGWLGVSLSSITDEFAKALGLTSTSGSFVNSVYLDSPAAKAGLKPGDYIIELNGKTEKDTDQLVREVGDLQAGEIAKFKVLRNGKEISLDVKIDSRENAVVNDSSKLWPGFIAYPLDDDTRKQLKLTDEKIQGIVVSSVQTKSPAALLRLQSGDIITAVNGKKVTTVGEFYAALAELTGKEVWFDLYADGRELSTQKFKF
ncbi:MAG: Do family serine endopeptidase [Treponemataceae bacterium]|nr:Do family serine endopeptidase [Treponemataceae bacterium]